MKRETNIEVAIQNRDNSEYGKLQSELATLRQQVATLTAERDALRHAVEVANTLAELVESYAFLDQLDEPDNPDSVDPQQEFIDRHVAQECIAIIRAANVLATPPRLDSEGARLPFALADDGEVSE